MFEKIKKIKENKFLQIIGKILYILLFVFVIFMLIIVILQRVSDNTIGLGDYKMFTVATGSMVPEYNVGDILISKTIDPSSIKVGDDVVYKGKEGTFKDRVVTHRVISIKNDNGTYRMITKGIANTAEDPEIEANQVYGKIIYKVKTLSYISGLITNIYIFYFFIFIPIGIIIFRQIKAIVSSKNDD